MMDLSRFSKILLTRVGELRQHRVVSGFRNHSLENLVMLAEIAELRLGERRALAAFAQLPLEDRQALGVTNCHSSQCDRTVRGEYQGSANDSQRQGQDTRQSKSGTLAQEPDGVSNIPHCRIQPPDNFDGARIFLQQASHSQNVFAHRTGLFRGHSGGQVIRGAHLEMRSQFLIQIFFQSVSVATCGDRRENHDIWHHPLR